MMDSVVYAAGVVALGALGVFLLRLLWEIAHGAALAASWIWWTFRLAKEHGIGLDWRKMPRTFLNRWRDFTLGNGITTTWSGDGGYWKGFRDWAVYPAKRDA